MLSAYPACFFKNTNGYSVVFPDLNNLSAHGHTLEEALIMSVDCLAGYLYWLKSDGEPAPRPSNVNQLKLSGLSDRADIIYGESFINMVTVDVAEYARKHFEKSVKKTLTIPAWLNNAAQERNINFSQVLQDALKQQLHIK